MVQFVLKLEIGSIDCKLIIRIQLRLHRILTVPWITARTLEHKHPMIYCRTVEVTEHILLW